MIFLLVFIICLSSILALPREVVELRTGWKFQRGHNEQAYRKNFNDSDWQNVNVPHDWAIEESFIPDGNGSTGKLPWKGEGWYRKKLPINEQYKGKRVYLLCDGIMAFPEIYVNGELAGEWDYGYNSFYIDITDFINFNDENILAVHADTRKHDSRWYPGAGIYRKIRMIVVNPIHVDIWGTYITTPIIKPHYTDARIATWVKNYHKTEQTVNIRHTVLTQNNNEIKQIDTTKTIPAQGKKRFEVTATIPDPRLWSLENPHLYTVVTKIYQDNKLIDEYHTNFGVRDIRFTADNGFYLNDKRIQLKGVNLHHDLGPLGAAFNKRAMERRLQIMKDMGCNAIRTSHNVPAPEILELCDRMGMLVFDEAFDKYDAKADIVDTTDFEDFAHRNLRNFVLRDRNHPSIFIWSVGNEVWDVEPNHNNGYYRLRTMLNCVEKYDRTRPTTLVCAIPESARLRHFEYYDVHCWNYSRRYRIARMLEPNKAVIISESASTVSTRGFYEFPLPDKKTDFTKSLQVSSYDLNTPPWAEISDDDFMWQQQEPYVAGEFVWTGFDYLGEPTPYDNRWVKEHGMSDKDASRSSYFGIVDLCGIPKDRYYLYKSYWKPDETTIHILPHWNWKNRIGKNVPVFVYTNGDCAELFLNGKSLGKKCKKPKSDNSVERFRLMWQDVTYQPGKLKAVAYKEGIKIGEEIIETTDEPYSLQLAPDRKVINADGKDLSYILIKAVDKEGRLCPLADDKIKIELDGPGKIAGVGNGNPQSMNPFKSSSVNLFYGKAMLIVQSDLKSGKIEIEASTPNMKDQKSLIKTE